MDRKVSRFLAIHHHSRVLCPPVRTAKFSRALIQHIYAHAAAEGWLAPGSTIVDPFGGVGLGAWDAMALGCRWIGVELEQPFTDLGTGCDCTGISKADWVRYYGRWTRLRYADGHYWCPRCLTQTSQRTGMPVARRRTFRTRPRPGQRVRQRTVPFLPLPFPDRQDGVRPPPHGPVATLFAVTTTSYAHNSGTIPSSVPHHYQGNLETWAAHGHTGAVLLRGDSRQLQAVLAGQVTACVSSPPYADGCAHTGGADRRPEHIQGGTVSVGLGYSAIVSSPPYAGSTTVDGRAITDAKTHTRPIGSMDDLRHGYGMTPGQLGALPPGDVTAVVSSPPYAGAGAVLGTHNGIDYSKVTSGGTTRTPTREASGLGYGTTPGQLGTAAPTTFWSAAVQILRQTFDVLRPGGHALWVVKGYCRDWTIVDFPGDWRLAAESVGFETLHEHHALLTEEHGTQETLFSQDGADMHWTDAEGDSLLALLHTTGRYTPTQSTEKLRTKRVSFFRRLHENKRPDLAIAWETVYCMRKPAPLPPEDAWQQLPLIQGCACTISSPPYAESFHGQDERTSIADRRQRTSRLRQTGGATGTNSQINHPRGYGSSPGQLAAMPPGQLDCAVSSPPYADIVGTGQRGGLHYRTTAGGPFGHSLTALADTGYGTTAGQLSAMPAGHIDCAVSSPPYNLPMSQDHNGSRGGRRGTTPSEAGAFVKYGTTPGQLEGMPPGTPPGKEEA